MSAWVFVRLGLIGLLAGGELLVRGAVSAAKSFGISPMVIGLTLVGFGTSTPELVTSLAAALDGSSGIAIGNVVGRNIGNVLLILGILGNTALVQPMQIPAAIIQLDIWVMCGATALLVIFARTGWQIGRKEDATMIACYVAYLGWLLI